MQMLQDVTSEVCGLYCIYVLYELNRGSSLQNILSNFSKDNLIKNDNDVLLWFSRKKILLKEKKKKIKYLKKKMINPKYLSPEIKDKLNRLPLELCEYRYTSKFKKDIVLKWIEIVGQKTVYIKEYLNMIDTLTDHSPYWRSCLRKILTSQ